MGQFFTVVVDDRLPCDLKKKSSTQIARRASVSQTGEWWVPLCEKAYAKFIGSYKTLVGGKPCWGLTELTGGITIQSKVNWVYRISQVKAPFSPTDK